MAEEDHSLVPLPAWARVVRQLQTPLRVYQEQVLRLYQPLQRYQRQLQDTYGPMFRYWERFVYWERSFGPAPFGFQFGAMQRQEPFDEQTPVWAWSPSAINGVVDSSRGAENVGRAGPDPMGPDELRRQLARVEERLREMGALEQEVEDLLASIRAELARQPGGPARGSVRA